MILERHLRDAVGVYGLGDVQPKSAKTNPLMIVRPNREIDETKPNNRGKSGTLIEEHRHRGSWRRQTPPPVRHDLRWQPERKSRAPDSPAEKRRGARTEKMRKQTHFEAAPRSVLRPGEVPQVAG